MLTIIAKSIISLSLAFPVECIVSPPHFDYTLGDILQTDKPKPLPIPSSMLEYFSREAAVRVCEEWGCFQIEVCIRLELPIPLP